MDIYYTILQLFCMSEFLMIKIRREQFPVWFGYPMVFHVRLAASWRKGMMFLWALLSQFRGSAGGLVPHSQPGYISELLSVEREDYILALSFSKGLPPSPRIQQGSKDPGMPPPMGDNNVAEGRK